VSSPETQRAFALGFALLASACPSESSEKSEAATVSRSVTAVREADNEKKPALLKMLRDTACSSEDICAVRSACLAAYGLHVETLERASEAVRSDAGDAASLDALKNDLARARDLASKCTDLQGELIRRYKL